MHAIEIENQKLVWNEVPDPEPTDGEVIVDVRAAALNRADILQRRGHYPPPPGAPAYPGLECAGVISAVGGGVTGHQPGDRVCALLAGGGYAERVAVPAGQLLPVPAGISLTEAATLPEAACTVWSNVVDLARLRAGETFLVHGGSGGIGTFAIQLGKALGATVAVTARAHKHDRLTELGADRVIDYTTADFVSEVGGADVILDIIGAKYLARNIAALNPDGRIAIIGMQGGSTAELNLGALTAKRGTITATTLRARPLADKARIVRQVREQVWPLVESGAIRPVVDESIPLAQAQRAHHRMEAGDHLGKIVLTVSRP
ncbi:NAD(P)H-quinone oxidoreductase [Mangrovihabitans endophyticus]|uniref:NAD(P)H-quinone oxidoreductase n=1 Tax=Mangrovihabitans endophyticus TaxID=1751298 RepID=UPI0016681288|nr:NAD(P)H-quinone oxidoreductase [Mangrovihabitans endophyticus]